MNLGRPVYWHEGVFLRPQHFQQQDDWHDARLQALWDEVRPHAWGVRSLEISEGALKEQVFDLVGGEFLFPDGASVRVPGSGRFHSRSFEGLWDPSGRPLPVYLGLRKLSLQGVNASEDAGGTAEPPRFGVSDPATTTKDLYARDEGQPVLYLEYNLRVFFGAEAAEATEYHLIQVAEIERSGNDIRAVRTFVPPSVTVDASPCLVGILRELKEQLTARGHELALYKQGQGAEATDLGARNLLPLLGLMCLNRWIPLVHHRLEGHRLSPWDAYGLLRQIVGELSAFSTHYDVFGAPVGSDGSGGLPTYRHTDLRGCFTEAARTLSRLLEELTAGPDFVAPLLFDGTYYYADVPGRIFQGANRMYLSVRAKGNLDPLVSAVEGIAKLSSKEYLPILIARALPGIATTHLPSPPSELPRRPDNLYFSLTPGGVAWDAFRENLNLGVYFENVPEDLEIELLVIYGD